MITVGWAAAALAAWLWMPPAASAQTQAVSITGQVTTSGGSPAQNATVFIESLGLSTPTRSDGAYTLTVRANRVFGQDVFLGARLVGYKSQLERIKLTDGPMTVNFVLEANPFQLGEIVVTGAGTEAEFRQLSIERKGVESSLILASYEPNVVQSLAGKMAGVNVTQASGEPGSNSRVQIRGIRSLSGTGQPLIVVDGLPINNSTNTSASGSSGQLGGTTSRNRASDINPNDIASIEVLSGASSAAIYAACPLALSRDGEVVMQSLRTSLVAGWARSARPRPLRHTSGLPPAERGASLYPRKSGTSARDPLDSSGLSDVVVADPAIQGCAGVFDYVQRDLETFDPA